MLLSERDFTGNEFEGGSTREDVTGADYILLTHSHFDHDIDLGYFVEKFHSLVFCGSMSAEEVLKFHKIPYDNMIPVYPNCHYNLPDLQDLFPILSKIAPASLYCFGLNPSEMSITEFSEAA